MKKILLLPFIISLIACAKAASPASPELAVTPLPALPKSWIEDSPQRQTTLDDLETPAPATGKAIEQIFKEHTLILESVPRSAGQVSAQSGHPKDWTPWHLDGMIANFGIDTEGVFGALMLDGNAVVQAQWQQKKPVLRVSSKSRSASRPTLHFASAMTEADVSAALEPFVQLAIKTGKVKRPQVLRSSLHQKAVQFSEICQALQSLTPAPGWHADSFQLQLNITDTSQVTPLSSAGGFMTIIFDWNRAEDVNTVNIDPAVYRTPLYRNLAAFIKTVASLVPDAKAESHELQGSEFDMDQIQIGIGVLANGDIGLTQASGSLSGKLIFNSDLAGAPALEDKQLAEVPIITGTQKVVKISAKNFKAGLRRAIKMATFFVKRAKTADTGNWILTQIQSEFDASLSGALRMGTLGAQGQLILVFDRKKP